MPTLYAGSAAWPREQGPAAVAIGNFDGVHAGHRALVSALMDTAAALGARPLVYTFEPAPTAVLARERHQPRILPLPDRVRLLGDVGVPSVVVERFSRAFAAHPAGWFVEHVLRRRLRAAAVVVGYDFRFGMGRDGDVHALRRLGPELRVVEVPAFEAEGAPVSSSRVRKLVAAGEVEAAARLLGRPHRLAGTVVRGDQLGRTIGFPTANLESEVELLPADGVYAVRASVDEGPWTPAVMNVGVRPTVEGTTRRLEVHVLEGGGDWYGAELRVDLVARLRGERRFPDLDALRAQIAADVAAARGLLGAP